ncbi:MAG TPA: phage holin family protein [Marmoricola sp.]|jgi:putative membrane protein|nr:phage holin family protein [Marmoricola sp.]
MKFVWWVVINAIGVGAAVWLFDDITLTASSDTKNVETLLIVGLIFGIINAVVRPVINMLALPLIIFSLGLGLIITNALMLLLTSKVAGSFNLHFHVHGFWTAVWGGIVISIASMIAHVLLPDGDKNS